MEEFEPHVRPNRSSLQAYLIEITKMRSLNWPYRKIVLWLLDYRDCRISKEALRQFCMNRGILKGEAGSPSHLMGQNKDAEVATNPGLNAKGKPLFDFDDFKPIQRKH